MSICKGVHHISLAVADREVYERTLAFYRDVLGFAFARSWSNPPKHITMLNTGNCMLELVLGAEGSGMGTFAHVALAVAKPEDVDALLDACVAAGCKVSRPVAARDTFEDGAVPGEKGRPMYLRTAFCTGLAGEQLEIFYTA